MSDTSGTNLGTAKFIITGDASTVDTAVGKTVVALSRLERTVATNWWGVKNLALAFAAFPTAVVGGLGVAVNAATQWQDSMFELQRTSGLLDQANAKNRRQFQQMEKDILNVAAVTPLATSELAALAAQGAALGVPNQDLAEFAKIMGTLIASTNLTANNVEDVARTLNVLQIPVDQFDNFASTLVTVGRTTAATETDIIDLARRLAGAAQVAGIAAPNVLAIAAAVRSLGTESQAGATAVQKTLIDMAQAIGEGGDKLDLFAKVSGQTIDEFVTQFSTRPEQALNSFLKGLGGLQGGLVGTTNVMSALDITEQRQIRALLALATGTRATGDKQRDLNAIMDTARDAWLRNVEIQQIAEARTRTVSGAMQLLRNSIFDTSQGFGQQFLPLVMGAIHGMTALVKGIALIPAPLRNGILLFAGLGAVLTGIIALAFLVGARFMIAADALRQLAVHAATGGMGLEGMAAAAKDAAAANEQLAFSGMAAAEAAQVEATSTEVAAGRILFMGKAALWGAKAMGILAVGMGVLMFQQMRQGQESLKQLENTQKMSTASRVWAEGMIKQGAAVGDVTKKLVESDRGVRKLSDSAKRYGVNQEQVTGIITGTIGTGKEFNAVVDKLTAAYKNGSKGAGQVLSDLAGLHGKYQASSQAASVYINQSKGAADATNLVGSAAKNTSKALQEEHDRLEGIAQAHIDYIGAVLNARAADFQLQDSLDALKKAQLDAANHDREIAKATDAVTQARLDQQQAVLDLADAETKAAHAREEAAKRVADAEFKLADAQDSLYDANQKVQDAEEKLAKLRQGPATDEITKAENKLAEARLKLISASRKVEDAEWYLQHLREQGAGARDIKNAEYAISVARQDVASSTQDVADAQKELNDLKDPVKQAKAIADAQRDLEKAQRDVAQQTRNVQQAETDLADARAKQASDRDFIDAQRELEAARLKVADATRQVKEAEENLFIEAAKDPTRDVAKAQLDYEQQLWNTAQAHAEVTKQTALMNGEEWNAGLMARALADELGKLNVQTQSAIDLRNAWLDTLSKAPNVPPAPKSGADGGGDVPDIGGGGAPEIPVDLGLDPGAVDKITKGLQAAFGKIRKQKWWETALAPMAGMLIAGLVQALAPLAIEVIGGLITALAAALGVSVGILALGAAIVAVLVAGIVAVLIKTGIGSKILNALWKAIQGAWNVITEIGVWIWQNLINGLWQVMAKVGWGDTGKNIIQGLWNGIKKGFDLLKDFASMVWGFLVDAVKALFGISSPSKVMSDIGSDIIQGLWNGIQNIWDEAIKWIGKIGGWILDKFVDAVKWLYNKGKDILQGLWDGVKYVWGLYWNWYILLPFKIIGLFAKAITWLAQAGKDVISGLWNGFKAVWEGVAGVGAWLGGLGWKIIGFFAHAIGWLFSAGKDVIQGLYDGAWQIFTNFWKFLTGIPDSIKNFFGHAKDWLLEGGKAIMQGLKDGLQWGWDHVVKGAWNTFIKAIPGGFADGLVIRSPSKLFHHYGVMIMQGLINGLKSQQNVLVDQMGRVVDAASMDPADLTGKLGDYGLGYLLGPNGVGRIDINDLAKSAPAQAGVVNNYHEELNLEAITSADPSEIMNEYVWANRVKSRL